MKLTNFTKGIFALVFVGAFLLPSKADAKMFGQECSSVTIDNGYCSVVMTTCVQRFFWINVGSDRNMSDYSCLVDQ
jgi:hypothetical protein